MRALLLTALLLLTPGAAWSQSLDDAPPIYVAGVYDQLANGGDYDPPDALYTPRLLALWEDMRRDSGGEVGRVDFFYWTNAQDWTLSDLSIGSAFVDGHEDRMTVTASLAGPSASTFISRRPAAAGGWMTSHPGAPIPGRCRCC